MLEVVEDDLEDAFLFQGFILVLLGLRLECVDWAIKLLFREGLRIDGRGSEYYIVRYFQGL